MSAVISRGAWGATQFAWSAWRTICPEDLLPVASQLDAKVSPNSALKAIGKTPSTYDQHGQVIGLTRWTRRVARDSDINRWSQDPDHGICVQTRRVRALDGDVPEPTLAESIRAFIMTYLELVLGMPTAPLRYRSNSSKFLIPVIVEGELGKRILTVGESTDANGKVERWRIEFLGNGQQFVAEGTHPSGVRYEWTLGGKSWDHSLSTLPVLSVEEFDGLWQALVDEFGTDEEARKAALKTASLPQRGQDGVVLGPDGQPIVDDFAEWLLDQGLVLGSNMRGHLFVECPNAASHTSDSGVSQAAYLPAGVGGSSGAFRCLHAGCAGVTVSDLREAHGYVTPAAKYFDDLDVTDPLKPGETALGLKGLAAAAAALAGPVGAPSGGAGTGGPPVVPPPPGGPVAAPGPPAPGGTPGLRRSDMSLGDRFVRLHGGHGVCYDHTAKSWRHYSSGVWQRCTKEQQQLYVRAVAQDVEQGLRVLTQGGASQAVLADARAALDRATSRAGSEAMLALARAHPSIARDGNDFDQDPWTLATPNGLVDLRTGALLPHDPDRMISRCSPVRYVPGAPRPRFERFLWQVSREDPEWVSGMQRWVGYCLTGSVREEVAAFWYGSGANGKSVLANLLRRMMGEYADSVSMSFLVRRDNNAGGPAPDLAKLAGLRLAQANEVESGSRLSSQTLKVAVSTEAISARALYANPITFLPTAKLIIRGNHKPRVDDTDEGLWRRLHLVPFDLRVDPLLRDPTLEASLAEELEGILAWAVEGAVEWYATGLRPCPRVRAASEEYRRESDRVGCWLSDRCSVGADPATGEDDREAYSDFTTWCKEGGVLPWSKNALTRALEERGIERRRGRRPASEGGGLRYFYAGLTLTERLNF